MMMKEPGMETVSDEINLKVGWSNDTDRLMLGAFVRDRSDPFMVFPMFPQIARALAKGILEELDKRGCP